MKSNNYHSADQERIAARAAYLHTKEDIAKISKILHVFGPWKKSLTWHEMGPEVFFPTKPDLADILGDADFDFGHFHLCRWIPTFQFKK